MASHKILWLAFVGFYLIGFASNATCDETVAIKDLPTEVAATVTQRYPTAKLTDARKTLEDKELVYEVDLTHEKKEIEMAISPDRRILWVAVEFPLRELPKVVLAGVHKKYPAGTLKSAATVFTLKEEKDQFLHFSIELTTKAGKRHELDVSAKGVIEEDEEITN